MNRIIDDVCKIGQGAACCRYLAVGAEGWRCLKIRPDMKAMIDARADRMNAKGDNCEGRSGELAAPAE
jgi:hypothetical protein